MAVEGGHHQLPCGLLGGFNQIQTAKADSQDHVQIQPTRVTPPAEVLRGYTACTSGAVMSAPREDGRLATWLRVGVMSVTTAPSWRIRDVARSPGGAETFCTWERAMVVPGVPDSPRILPGAKGPGVPCQPLPWWWY